MVNNIICISRSFLSALSFLCITPIANRHQPVGIPLYRYSAIPIFLRCFDFRHGMPAYVSSVAPDSIRRLKTTIIMQTTNLQTLRSLRIQEKAIKAQIDAVIDAATQEAVAILAEKGQDRGEFEVDGVGSFQLQRTDVFNLADYNKYKGEEAVNWRKEAKKKCKNQGLVKACTASMAGFLKTFVELNPDKEPDEIRLTVKCVGLD